jgi:hypothetical protein
MTKVYLLLRNNKQSGPHSLEELLKLELKPADLIWVDGRSTGWSYPYEIAALKPYVPAPPEKARTQENTSHDDASQTAENLAYMPAGKPVPTPTETGQKPKVFVSMPAGVTRPAEAKKSEPESTVPDTADIIEQKAEALRKKIQSYVPEQKAASPKTTPPQPAPKVETNNTPVSKPAPVAEEPVITKYRSTMPEREEAYTSWIYNQKVNKSGKLTEVQKKWAAIGVAAFLILAIGFGITRYHSEKKEVAVTASAEVAEANNALPAPLITDENKSATEPLANDPPAGASQPADEIVPKTEPENHPAPVNEASKKEVPAKAAPVKVAAVKPASIKELPKKVAPAKEAPAKVAPTKVVLNKEAPAKVVASKVAVKTEAPAVKKNTPEIAKQGTTAEAGKKVPVVNTTVKETPVKIVAETKPVEVKPAPKTETAPAVAAPQKKKSINEKVDAFFDKIAHKTGSPSPTPPVDAGTNNSNPSDGTQERKSAHRDEKTVETTSPPVNRSLAEYVEVTSTKPSENWMLGVHGMKVSLHNTGFETVKVADVELRYYSEQNELLEKKTVSFTNIAPGKIVTLPAPDHRLADHADVRLVSAK